ncbi:hypothetical protein [Brevundimonas faecalis]|uniref:Uncharacterized protein n=1 Tax=Brevundimonas faecalis TaxID=947378 RepID=A0ABV2RBR6_9CAUL
MSEAKIELLIASPPDRDFLTCELSVGNEVIAEVRIEPPGLAVEIYPKSGNQAWDIPYDELMDALVKAKTILSEVDTSVKY